MMSSEGEEMKLEKLHLTTKKGIYKSFFSYTDVSNIAFSANEKDKLIKALDSFVLKSLKQDVKTISIYMFVNYRGYVLGKTKLYFKDIKSFKNDKTLSEKKKKMSFFLREKACEMIENTEKTINELNRNIKSLNNYPISITPRIVFEIKKAEKVCLVEIEHIFSLRPPYTIDINDIVLPSF